MISERLQVLLTPEQRRRLDREAREQARSVASLVREAIDARFNEPTREDRIAAVEEIKSMNSGVALTPEDLRRIIDESHTEEILRGIPGSR
ncbi:MAG: hypothetical protein ACREQM_13375 [Candidatus Dormibacteraceae bacterium]